MTRRGQGWNAFLCVVPSGVSGRTKSTTPALERRSRQRPRSGGPPLAKQKDATGATLRRADALAERSSRRVPPPRFQLDPAISPLEPGDPGWQLPGRVGRDQRAIPSRIPSRLDLDGRAGRGRDGG